MSRATQPNSVVLWEGPSRIDGGPVLLILTGLVKPSSNRKTGHMLQTYILRADVSPIEALHQGLDVSICGGCPLRGDGSGKHRTCYVNVGQAPLGLWKAWKRGSIPGLAKYGIVLDYIAYGEDVRLGAYGDPAAIPIEIWDRLLSHAAGWTGYTHQAKRPDLRDVLKYCMVSCDDPADAADALAKGYGSFTVVPEGSELPIWASWCPADGLNVTCSSCMRCSGPGQGAVFIEAHGVGRLHLNPKPARLRLPVIQP